MKVIVQDPPNGSLDLCCNNQDLLPNQTWKKRLKISDAGSQLVAKIIFEAKIKVGRMHLTCQQMISILTMLMRTMIKT